MKTTASTARRLAAGAALGLVLVLAGCNSRATNPSPPAPEVGVANVVVRPIRDREEFNGRVAAIRTVDVRPRVSGYIDRVLFKDGDDLKADNLLFVIDQRPYKAALESAEAQLQHARATAVFATAQLGRAQTLTATQVMPRQELDNRQAALSQAQADIRAAEAAVTTARLNLTFSEVRAPVAGRAGRAMMNVGNLVQADQSLLVTVVPLDPIYVYFDWDEHSYLRHQANWKGRRGDALDPVKVALANEDGFPHPGRIDFLDNRLDPATGTLRARVVLANPDRTLTPGLFARVQLEGADPHTAMLIDDKAVLTDQDRKYVYVVGANNKAQRKEVQLGTMAEGLRVVRSGLDAHDRVVVVGTQKILFPGMRVTPRPHGLGKPQTPPTKTAR